LTLAGWIDVAQRNRVAGWAMRSDLNGAPVMLDLSVAATLRAPARSLGQFLANRYRPDLDTEGFGTGGRAGFDLDLRDYALPAGSFLLDIRDAKTAARLPGAPHFIPSADFAPYGGTWLLCALDGAPVCRLPDDVIGILPHHDGRLRIDLPPGTAGIMLCPRARTVPGDQRRLGAVIADIALDGTAVDIADPALVFGFHDVEGEQGRRWRWIDDAAFIGIGPSDTASVVEIDIHGLLPAPSGSADEGLRLSACYRMVEYGLASVPYVGSRFLAPPLSPAKRRVAVRGPAT